jgi:hypothetical protein
LPHSPVVDPPATLFRGAVGSVIRDKSGEEPLDQATFEAFLQLYRYDRTPLAVVNEPAETTATWTKETISFNAAYGKERMRALLFLPKNAAAWYQLIAYRPQGEAFMLRSTRDLRTQWIEYSISHPRCARFSTGWIGTSDR